MTFNIAFFADAHIDYSYATRTDEKGVNLRVRDGYNALHEIITDIVAHKDVVDAVVMGGDLFHTSHPSVRSIAIVQHYLRELSRNGLTIDILAGNHDATDDRSYPAAVAVVDDPERGIYAHYTPYVKRHLADGVLLHVLSHHGLHADDAPEMEPVDGIHNIFTTHGAAIDPDNKALMRCMDSPREQIVGPEIVLSEAFDLRLLGHFHSRAFVGHESLNTWYAGSTLRRGFSDSPGGRGWSLFKIHEDGSVEVEHHDIYQRPQFDLPLIDATGLGAAAIQEQILLHLDGTREDETNNQFNPLRAPILRQRVINIPTSVRDGLDRKLITDHASHSLKWLLETIKPEPVKSTKDDVLDFNPDEDETVHDHSAPSISRTSGSVNVVDSYHTWVEQSQTIRHIQEERREPVVSGAVEHLQRAQDAENSN